MGCQGHLGLEGVGWSWAGRAGLQDTRMVLLGTGRVFHGEANECRVLPLVPG